ncbi:unnamed protein product [Eretmochelys imbricata]
MVIIPLHPDSQYLFAFTWKGQQLTWTRLPQGFSGSPTIFSWILTEDLKDIVLPSSSVLVQYVDDLLIAASDYNACLIDSVVLLTALANKGHRASPSKLQLCLDQVIYLSFVIRPGERLLSPDRVRAIQDYPRPTTKKQLRAFLGAAKFCRPWVVAFEELVKPLVQATTTLTLDPVSWTPEIKNAFKSVKKALISAPALGFPNYSKPFSLFTHERQGVASGVLLQYLGGRPRPVAYYSVQLDSVIQGSVSCVRSVAAAAVMVERSRPIVLGHPLTVWVPHEVEILLKQHSTQALSPQRAHKYELILLAADNVTLRRCNILNPATMLPLPENGTPHHVCMDVVAQNGKPRPDLADSPLVEPDLLLFTDGSSYYLNGHRVSGYSVTSQADVIEAAPLPPSFSAQGAELHALTRACLLSSGKTVTIYTDSKYAFGVCHATGQLWKQRGFLTSSGTKIANGPLISALLEAIQTPRQVAVVHCYAHRQSNSVVSQGNALADSAAKAAALQPLLVSASLPLDVSFPPADWTLLYADVSLEELHDWKRWEGSKGSDKVWRIGNKPILPRRYLLAAAHYFHSLGHAGIQGTVAAILKFWAAPHVYPAVKRVLGSCPTCLAFSAKTRLDANSKGGRPWANFPFQRLQMDYAEMPKCSGFHHLLVIVDQLSGWPEAIPTRKADARSVVKFLMKDIVPRFGVPEVIDSDRGSHFTAKILEELYRCLGIIRQLHTPYHPQSAGQVERMNRTIKTMVAKFCKETGLKWPEALPIVLWHIRRTPRMPLGLSPFEVLFGRPALVPGTYVPVHASLLDGDETLARYVARLQKELTKNQSEAQLFQTAPLGLQVHSFKPGNWVMVKKIPRTDPLEPRWEGPYQVLLCTYSALKVAGKGFWIHHSYVKLATEPPPDPGEPADEPLHE